MVLTIILTVLVAVVPIVVGLSMIIGRQRFARNASAASSTAQFYSSPRSVAAWGAVMVVVGLVPLAYVLIVPEALDGLADRMAQTAGVQSVLRAVAIVFGVGALALGSGAAVAVRRARRDREQWPTNDAGQLLVPRSVRRAILLVVAALACAVVAVVFMII